MTDQQVKEGTAPAPAPAVLPPPRAVRRRKRRLAFFIAAVVLLLIGVVIFYYLRFVAPYESTDDAFIQAHVTVVSPRVSGPVVRLLIRDNQQVKAGDPLLEIDPKDYETAVAQAQADLDTMRGELKQAQAQVLVDEAKAAQQTAAMTAAAAQAHLAKSDLERYQALESRAVARTQLDLEQTQAESTSASLEAARNQAKAADAQLGLTRVSLEAAAAKVQQAEAKLAQAQLNLSYTKISAPTQGRVTQRTVEQGAYLQTGQSLLALVPPHVWVVANFKETQLTHMRPGQPVRIHVDAYPKREFKGRVDSLQAGSGAQFSLLPPENAVGNYVKVVQRVPVKIEFDEPLDQELDIAPGMSVEPKVKVE